MGPSTANSSRLNTPSQHQKLRVQDDSCSVTINTSRFKGEKGDFRKVKASLQKSINEIDVMKQAKIVCLRQLPGERINVVFASEAEAIRARENLR